MEGNRDIADDFLNSDMETPGQLSQIPETLLPLILSLLRGMGGKTYSSAQKTNLAQGEVVRMQLGQKPWQPALNLFTNQIVMFGSYRLFRLAELMEPWKNILRQIFSSPNIKLNVYYFAILALEGQETLATLITDTDSSI